MTLSSTHEYSNDVHLNPPWYRKAWFLATAVGLVMLLVVASIFTVSSLARDVSRLAQASHSTNEALRVASVVQTEFATADAFRRAGSELDTATVVNNSAELSAAGLTNLLEVVEDPTLPISISQELEIYIDAAQTHLANPTGDMTLEQVASSFERLSDALGAERSAFTEELERVNSRMNSVAAIAGFAIAFLVPATGLYVWEALRRSTGRQRSLEHQIAEFQTDSLATSGELVSSVAGLKALSVNLLGTLGSSEPSAALQESEELVQAVERLHRDVSASDSLETVVHRPARLVDMVRDGVNTSMVPTVALPSRSELSPDIVVVIDSLKMSSALSTLIQTVATTSTTVRLNVGVFDTSATVELEHNGTQANPSLSESDSERVGQLIKSAGGKLSFEPGPVVSTYSLTMPLATSEGFAASSSRQAGQLHQ